jgi:hypothetical protein
MKCEQAVDKQSSLLVESGTELISTLLVLYCSTSTTAVSA